MMITFPAQPHAGVNLKTLRYFSATTRLVTRMFAIASGNRNFQPNAINWS